MFQLIFINLELKIEFFKIAVKNFFFSLQDILIFKDKEIASKDENINNLENQLKVARMDSDRAAVMELMEVKMFC